MIAWENAAALGDMLNQALTKYFVEAHDTAPSLDEPAVRLTSDSDVVLGVRGKRVAGSKRVGGSLKGSRVEFTYRQTMAMAATLGHLLPRLADDARRAREELLGAPKLSLPGR
jgi:hypothetical protein